MVYDSSDWSVKVELWGTSIMFYFTWNIKIDMNVVLSLWHSEVEDKIQLMSQGGSSNGFQVIVNRRGDRGLKRSQELFL
jgi:hypothetical protein